MKKYGQAEGNGTDHGAVGSSIGDGVGIGQTGVAGQEPQAVLAGVGHVDGHGAAHEFSGLQFCDLIGQFFHSAGQGLSLSSRSVGIAAGNQGQSHGQNQQHRNQLLHCYYLRIFVVMFSFSNDAQGPGG